MGKMENDHSGKKHTIHYAWMKTTLLELILERLIYFWLVAKNLLRSSISEASVNSRNGVKLGQ